METPIRKRRRPSREWRSRQGSTIAPEYGIKKATRAGFDVQPRRFLLEAAQQSGIGDPHSCRVILAILSANRAIRRALGRELGFQENSGARFGTLVTLYAFSPLPATAADLAYHAEVSRLSIMRVIETLEQRGLITWDVRASDCAAPIRLTELGHEVALVAVHRFLKVARNLAEGVGAPNRKATIETCGQIERRSIFS